jgi:ABC-type multidrug transport system fused ATPase/permease subunit
LKKLSTVAATLTFCDSVTGQSAGMAPDYGQAVLAARRVVKLLQYPTIIDPASREGKTPEITGKVEFSDVEFSYPTRKDVLVLKGLKTVVEPGQTLALVGQSGCGKSTCISLLERFYNATAGEVKIDGIDVTSMNLKWLRSNVGLVQQEPVLFANWVFNDFY